MLARGEASLQRRFADGLGFLVSYTLAKSLQSGDDSGFSTFNGQPINQFNPRAEWAVGNGDRRHNLVISGVYELPIRPQNKLAKNLIGGWQVSGSVFYRSGSPYKIEANGSPLFSGNRANWDPNVPLDVDWSKAKDAYRSPNKNEDGIIMFPAPLPGDATPFDVFNITAFSSPGRVRLGDSPRRINGVRGPWDAVENLALTKHLYFGNSLNASLRIEFFNLFNRQGYCAGDLGTNVDNRDTFGLSKARRIRDSQGRVIGIQVQECQGQTPRRGQIFLRLTF